MKIEEAYKKIQINLQYSFEELVNGHNFNFINKDDDKVNIFECTCCKYILYISWKIRSSEIIVFRKNINTLPVLYIDYDGKCINKLLSCNEIIIKSIIE